MYSNQLLFLYSINQEMRIFGLLKVLSSEMDLAEIGINR
jgi:hypothetical protein